MKYRKHCFIRGFIILAILLITFIVAIIFSIMPLPYKFKWLMPNWTILVLINWIIFVPHFIGLIFTFLLGIFIDLLMGNLLGFTSLCFMPVAFLADFICPRFRIFNLLQQFLVIIMLISISHLIRLWLQLYINYPTNDINYWLTVPSSIIAWPFVCGTLNLLRKIIKFC